MITKLAAAVLGLLVVASVPTLAAAAPSAPSEQCSDNACVTFDLTGDPSVRPGEPVTVAFTLTVSGDAVQVADFTGSAADGLSVTSGSLVLDDTFVAGATYGAHSVSATLATPATPLAVGTHQLTFDVTAAESIGEFGSVDGELEFQADPSAPSVGSGTGVTVPVITEDDSIDLQVPNGAPLLARPDSWVSVVGQYGTGTTETGVTLDLDLPAGLGTGVRAYLLAGDGGLGRALSCTPGSHSASCALPAAGPNGSAELVVFLPTLSQTPVGTTKSVQFEIAGSRGVSGDPNPKNNFAFFRVRFVPRTDVSYSVERTVGDTPVGSTAHVIVTVTNNATSTAPTLSGQFTFDPSLDELNPPFDVTIDGPGLYGGGGSLPFHVAPLAPGATATYRIAVTPNVAHRTLTIDVLDDTFSPTPDCFDVDCDLAVYTFVTSAEAGSPPLANSGTPVTPQVLAALLLLVAGCGLTAAGRRRS